MAYEITFTKTLSEQFMRDVMTTMVESGPSCLWYWAKPINVDRDEETLDVTGLVVSIEDYESDDSRCTINGTYIKEAIEAILAGHMDLAPYIVTYIRDAVFSDDSGCIDAEAADAIAQHICCGEIVYG